jgi:hypothetical protein
MSGNYSLLRRGDFTYWLLQYLSNSALEIEIGDGLQPKGSGWVSSSGVVSTPGAPGTSFIPFVVLNTGGAQPMPRDTLADPYGYWQVDYSMRCAGSSRRQTEQAADDLREVLVSTPAFPVQLLLGDDEWKLLSVAPAAIGAVNRNDAVQPPVWEQLDSYRMQLSRAVSLSRG